MTPEESLQAIRDVYSEFERKGKKENWSYEEICRSLLILASAEITLQDFINKAKHELEYIAS